MKIKKNHGKNPAPRIVPLKTKKKANLLSPGNNRHPGVMVCFVPSHSSLSSSQLSGHEKNLHWGYGGITPLDLIPPSPNFGGGRNRAMILAQTRYGDTLVKLVSRKGPWSCAFGKSFGFPKKAIPSRKRLHFLRT